MNLMTKVAMTLFIMNIFVYVGLGMSMSLDGERSLNQDYKFHFEGDIIATLLNGSQNFNTMLSDYQDNYTNYDYDFAEGTVRIPTETSGSVASDALGFLDSLKMVMIFIRTVANIGMAPLALFFNFQMPVYIGIMIGFPYFLLFMFGLISFIRSGN